MYRELKEHILEILRSFHQNCKNKKFHLNSYNNAICLNKELRFLK